MRDFSSVKRIVIKIGTNLISTKSGVNKERIKEIVEQVAKLREEGLQILIVSSGAVGLGAKALNHKNEVKYIALKQACASIGQPELMAAWAKEFKKYNLLCSQILITRSVLNNRKSYNNLRTTVMTLLELGVIPIFNENDVISTSEINNVFGDNDRMSAYVASKIDASLLLLLTDIDGLYTDNPKTNKEAKLITELDEVDSTVLSWARGKGSTFSTGGMKTKLLASQIAQKGGCGTIIASGEEENVILKIMRGEERGTYIRPLSRISQRERWIINTPSSGSITVDSGAEKALIIGHKSLLPSGIVKIDGVFKEGDVVSILSPNGEVIMKAISSFNSSELLLIKGHSSSEINAMIGEKHKVVFRPEDAAINE